MNRLSLKIVGAAGQGLISIGEILAKAFKRSGYCVFGYREYMSLIKGGHGSYQLDVARTAVRSSEELVDVVIALNHHGFEHNLQDLKEGGVLIHDTREWEFSAEEKKMFAKRNIQVVYLPIADILRAMNAKPILANVVFSAFAWAACGGEKQLLKSLVGERFADKQDMLATNMQAIDAGYQALTEHAPTLRLGLPEPDERWSKQLLLTGSQAMGLGIVHAGVRFYAGYPMTPSSPLLTYIAELQNETGMLIKQAEDEITAVQMVSGAMFMGTRAITATSGGGFDLMTETISLNGIIENPCVIVLAQRPGPATGLPTWTAQGDLMLAIHGGHGEFPRCVLSVSDSTDSHTLVAEAFSIAEEFQTPVILLTDKHVAEGIYTQEPYTQKASISRGKLVTKPAALRALTSGDRYNPDAPDGISPRWLPGTQAATYVAQGDEHSADGSVDESAENAVAQMNKRMAKMDALKASLPQPELYMLGKKGQVQEVRDAAVDVLLVGWGSTKGVVLDALESDELHGKSIGYLHYTHLWPLRTERFAALAEKAGKIVFIENNYSGQLQQLLRQEYGRIDAEYFRKYDGRPFFLRELIGLLSSRT